MSRPALVPILTCLFTAIFGLALLSTHSFAKQGCCSDHGGVVGCNKATGYQMCKDGTTSPTCKCEGTTTTKTKHKTSNEDILGTLFGGSGAGKKTTKTTSTTEPTVTTTSTVGCCSGHGGVGKCDKKTGYLRCKDGTLSMTCKCPTSIEKTTKAKTTKAKTTKGKTTKHEKAKEHKSKTKTPKTTSTTA